MWTGDPHDAACAGWAGDRVWVARSGERTLVVWLLCWDSDDEAREFARAVSAMTERVPALVAAQVTLEGRRILILGGLSSSQREAVRAAAPAPR